VVSEGRQFFGGANLNSDVFAKTAVISQVSLVSYGFSQKTAVISHFFGALRFLSKTNVISHFFDALRFLSKTAVISHVLGVLRCLSKN